MLILDRYLLKTFMLPWVSCLLGFTFLFVVVDLVESLNHFLDAEVSLLKIATYYLRFLPSIWMYIGPITLLLGLLYALYQLTRQNEIIAMRAGGVSLYRVLLPFLLLGGVISLISLHISRTVAPRNLGWTQEFLRQMRHQDNRVLTDLRFRDPDTKRSWQIGTLNLDSHHMEQVTLMQLRPAGDVLEYVLQAEQAVWIDGYWFFHNVNLQAYSEAGYKQGPLEHRAVLPKQEITESPERILRETMSFDYMTSAEMKAYLRDRPSVSDRTRANLRTQLQMRLAHPWLCLVTMLLAVPFGTQTARKGVFVGMALCLLLFFALLFSMNLFKALGLSMRVEPWVAGWTPTLLFGAIGLVLLRRLR